MGPLAQSVEQRTFNPWVVGSIPTGPTSTGGNLLHACVKILKSKFQNIIAFILLNTDYITGDLQIFSLDKGLVINTVHIDKPIKDLFLSFDEELLFVVLVDGNIRIFDFPKGKMMSSLNSDISLKDLSSHNYLAISYDNKYLAILDDKNYFHVYDIASGKALSLIHRDQQINSFGFMPESDFIYTRGNEGANIFCWKIGRLVNKAKQLVLRNFSKEEWNDLMFGEPYKKVKEDLPVYKKIQ